MNAGKIYEKIHNGDPFSNTELANAIQVFSSLEENLKSLGPKFHLAWKEIFFDLETLKGFERNRNARS